LDVKGWVGRCRPDRGLRFCGIWYHSHHPHVCLLHRSRCLIAELLFSAPDDIEDRRGIIYDQNSLRAIGFERDDFILIALLVGGDYTVGKRESLDDLPFLTLMHDL
jgi:hypothetical protein